MCGSSRAGCGFKSLSISSECACVGFKGALIHQEASSELGLAARLGHVHTSEDVHVGGQRVHEEELEACLPEHSQARGELVTKPWWWR